MQAVVTVRGCISLGVQKHPQRDASVHAYVATACRTPTSYAGVIQGWVIGPNFFSFFKSWAPACGRGTDGQEDTGS